MPVTPERDAQWALQCARAEAEHEWREWNRLSDLAEEAQERAIRAMNRASAARRKIKGLAGM